MVIRVVGLVTVTGRFISCMVFEEASLQIRMVAKVRRLRPLNEPLMFQMESVGRSMGQTLLCAVTRMKEESLCRSADRSLNVEGCSRGSFACEMIRRQPWWALSVQTPFSATRKSSSWTADRSISM